MWRESFHFFEKHPNLLQEFLKNFHFLFPAVDLTHSLWTNKHLENLNNLKRVKHFTNMGIASKYLPCIKNISQKHVVSLATLLLPNFFSLFSPPHVFFQHFKFQMEHQLPKIKRRKRNCLRPKWFNKSEYHASQVGLP